MTGETYENELMITPLRTKMRNTYEVRKPRAARTGKPWNIPNDDL